MTRVEPARSFDELDREALVAAIDQLPEAQKPMVTLVDYDGQSVEAAGAAFRLSVEEAQQLHDRAMRGIAQTLGDGDANEQGEA